MQQNNILLEQNALIYEISIKTGKCRGFIPLWSYGESTRAHRMESIRPEKMHGVDHASIRIYKNT